MLTVITNPYAEPLKKLLQDLKETKWKFPYLLQIVHGIFSLIFLLLLIVLYLTVGFVSQVSNSFWDVIVGLGNRMSFSNPLSSLFYAISATVYFVFFLPFFILQTPFWVSGWLSSKIGLKPLIVLILTLLTAAYMYYYQPELTSETIQKIASFQDSIRAEYFATDSLSIETDNSGNVLEASKVK